MCLNFFHVIRFFVIMMAGKLSGKVALITGKSNYVYSIEN